MNFQIADLACIRPPEAIELCVNLPGGARLCATDLLNSADPFQVLQALFLSLNGVLAPLTPFFDVINVVEAIVNCIQAIPQCLEPPVPNPKPLIDCLAALAKALAKLLTLLPPLSVPIMLVDFLRVLIRAIGAFVARLQALAAKNAELTRAALKASKTGNTALKAVVDCATGNLAVDAMNLNAALGPLNQLIGLVNLFGSLVPGLPKPLIPSFDQIGPDATAAIQPLQNTVKTLQDILDSIPLP